MLFMIDYFNHDTFPLRIVVLRYPPDVLTLIPFHVTKPSPSVLKCSRHFSRIFFLGFKTGRIPSDLKSSS